MPSMVDAVDESVEGVLPETGVELLSSCSRSRASMSARSSAIVSNSELGARELVVGGRQDLLLDLLDRDVDAPLLAVGELERRRSSSSPTAMPGRTSSSSSASLPVPSSAM